MKKKKFKFKALSAKKFKNKDGYYLFPFEVLDKTPGGTNLGRIEWHIEPVMSRKKRGSIYPIEKLYVWASQTRDPRYSGKVFEIPTWAECMTAHVLGERTSFLHFVWRVMFCDIHKTQIFSAYPDNHHSALKINTFSSISIDADFV